MSITIIPAAWSIGPPARRMCSDFAQSSALAKELMGFEPEYTLEEGLKRTLDWYAEKNSHGQ